MEGRCSFLFRYYQLKADTSSAQSFTLLKNFFTYVDDLEYHVFNKRIEKVLILKIVISLLTFEMFKGEFKQAVEKITGLKITDRESEYLFKMVDANHDGIIDAENELNLHKHRTPEYVTYGREQTEILLSDQNHA